MLKREPILTFYFVIFGSYLKVLQIKTKHSMNCIFVVSNHKIQGIKILGFTKIENCHYERSLQIVDLKASYFLG